MPKIIHMRDGPLVDNAPSRQPYLMAEMTDIGKPDPMTRNQLLALRNSSSLEPNCHYVVTDYNRGNVSESTLLLHAVTSNSLSMLVQVFTTHDNNAWTGTYDIDVDRMESLSDNLGNHVRGRAAVDAFPWGVGSVSENEIHESIINYNSGSFTENIVHSNCTININGGSSSRNRFSQGVTANLNGIFSNNVVENDANVTVISGSNVDNRFGTSVNYIQSGTGYIRYSKIDGNSTITNGNTNITNSTFESASILNTTNSNGSISSSTFGYAILSSLQNIESLTISQSNLDSGCQVSANGAKLLRLFRSSGSDGGRYLVSQDASLTSNYNRVDSYGYIQVTRGDMNINYSKASSLGYISHQSTGSNRVERSEATSQANIRFLDTATGGRIYYCKSNSGSSIYQNGTSSNCYHYYCEASSNAQMYIENSVNARHYYNSASDFSYIRSYGNNTGQSIIYYSNASARGWIEHLNITSRQRFYSIDSSSQGIMRQTGGNSDANTYYSSVSSYYYALLTSSGVTRYGLHGSGRQSFTGQPATNGTGERNWT